MEEGGGGGGVKLLSRLSARLRTRRTGHGVRIPLDSISGLSYLMIRYGRISLNQPIWRLDVGPIDSEIVKSHKDLVTLFP